MYPISEERDGRLICGEAHIVNRTFAEGEASMLYCKRWSCPTCRPKNRWRVILNADAGRATAMLTLTIDPARYDTPDDAARDMVRGWRLFRRRLAKDKGIENLPFCVVFEQHKSGWPHMHLLIRSKFIAWGYIKRVWQETVGASHVHIRAIRGGRSASHYISKYIGKDPHAFDGCKRWWRSHNYDLTPEDDAEEFLPRRRWQRVDEHIEGLIAALLRQGCEIIEERPGYVRWTEECPEWRSRFFPRNGGGGLRPC